MTEKLAEENRDLLGLNLARPEGRHGKFLALLADRPRRNPFPPQLLRQDIFVAATRSPEIFSPECALA